MVTCKYQCVIDVQEAQVAIPCHPEMIITQKTGEHYATSIFVHHLQNSIFCEYCSPVVKSNSYGMLVINLIPHFVIALTTLCWFCKCYVII